MLVAGLIMTIGSPALAALPSAAGTSQIGLDQPVGPVPNTVRDATHALVTACQAWAPTTRREAPAPLALQPPHDPDTLQQHDLCEVVRHPDAFNRNMKMFALLSGWGILLSMLVAGYCLKRLVGALVRKTLRARS